VSVRARGVRPRAGSLPIQTLASLNHPHIAAIYGIEESNGIQPQHLYSVRFAARELWGEHASPRDFIHLDMWDDSLERG